MFGRIFFAAASLAALTTCSTMEVKAQTYPTGTVTFIEPFPVGGSIDVVMRAIAPRLQERFGKPFVVESHTGAGGMIATSLAAKASPDGHTLLAAASSLAANQELFKSSPYDTLRDLRPVSLVFRTPLLLLGNHWLRNSTFLVSSVKAADLEGNTVSSRRKPRDEVPGLDREH